MLTLGGKVYVPVNTDAYTLQYDLYMQRVLEDIGITSVLTRHSVAPEEDTKDRQALAEEVLRAIATSGKVTDLLAGLIRPETETWTIESAAAASRHMAVITDPGEKQSMMAILVAGLSSFFLAAPGSSRISH